MGGAGEQGGRETWTGTEVGAEEKAAAAIHIYLGNKRTIETIYVFGEGVPGAR